MVEAGLDAVMPSRLPTAHPFATLRRFLVLSGGYWTEPGSWPARLLSFGLVTFTVALVALAIRLNLWSADLFDALERREAGEVLAQAGIFIAIVLATVATTVCHLECKRRLQLGWRRWLTHRMVDAWMLAGHQHQLALMPGDHSNPDARIAEDIRLLTESAFELANSLLYCILVLVSFVSILWVLSGTIVVSVGGLSVDIQGHYVWLALIYAGSGTVVAFLLGRPLVRATDSRQTREADYRFELVRGREHGEAIALLAGEPEERRRLRGLFLGIEAAWRQQTASLRTLTMFSSAYSTLATMLPILIAAPRYLASEIALGGLMQAAQAFQQLTGALSWPVDNFQRLAEMFTSIERVLVLHDGLRDVVDQHRPGEHGTIAVASARGPALTVRDLSIAHPDGRAMFAGIDAEILPGERVLILGDPQLSRTFFKVIAGIWPWGAGQVDLPDDATILFVPHRLYFPTDTLRQVLAYPDEPTAFPTEAFAAVLDRVGLPDLRGRLDALEDWENVLDRAEQQRLGFAQALLKRPTWLFLEDPGDALGEESAQALLATLIAEMPNVTLLTISRRAEMEALYHRTLRLEPAADGHVFVRDVHGRRTRPSEPQ
ncbi:MAG: ABC transporter ATP-binding protein/permease [Alphaproteobacteria bacterium]|nr:ABC transporter ATP-binding protein/permease [Alphaproteobacteria bacterium]